MSRRVVVAAGLAAVVALLAAGVALADAGGQGTVTMTTHASDVPLFPPVHTNNPCTGAPGTLSAISANEVFHVTFFTAPGADEFWVTGTDEGTVTFTPDNPSDASASGHFAAWFGESGNNKIDIQHDTNTFNLHGSDGSHLVMHAVDHLNTALPSGAVTLVFDKMSMTCG